MQETPPAFYNDLDACCQTVRRLLEEAVDNRESPFRTPVIITVDEGVPEGRTVVLRQADWAERHLLFHSDWRSGKVREIRREPRVALVFYHPAEGIQVRVAALASLHHQDELARQAWSATPPENRVHYLGEAPPGREVEVPTSAPTSLPSGLEEGVRGLANFVVIRCQIWRMEWLYLSDHGHRRARFSWSAGVWKATWCVP